MTHVETSSPDPSLTGTLGTQESEGGSTEPAKANVLPEDAKNFQHALQKKQEALQQKERENDELRAQLREKEESEKRKKLSEMSEVDRYKLIAEDESKKRAELELRVAVSEALSGKNIPAAIVEMIRETPWAIPPVKRELGTEFSWDQAIDSVKRHLPRYVETLVVNSPTTSSYEEPSKRVDSERSVETSVTAGHIYTRSEVAKLSRDPKEYAKHEEAIDRQLSRDGGRLPD